MLESTIARVEYAVVEYGSLIAIVSALVGALALGGAGWVYTHPPTTEVTDHTHQRTVRSELTTSAVVTNDSILYDPGTRLQEQPVYLLSTTPVLTLIHETRVPSNRSVRVHQRATLVYRVMRDGDTVWNETTVLARERTTTRSGSVTTRSNLSIPRVRNRLESIRKEVGDAGTVQAIVRVSVAYELPRYRGTLNGSETLRISDRWYKLDVNQLERTHSTRVSRVVAVPGRGRTVPVGLGAVGGVLLLVGVCAAGIYHRRDGEPRHCEYRIHRQRYAGWISKGSIGDGVGDRTVFVASLEDLVDVAIDTGGRVIHDPDRDVYAVIDGATVYYFDRFWSSTIDEGDPLKA